jgi:protoheme IX farnesyltransferase
MLPWLLGFAGAIYGATAVVCGAILVALALQLRRSSEADRRPAHRLFAFSIFHLFVLFVALLACSGNTRWSPTHLGRAASNATGLGQAESLARPVRIALGSTILKADRL